ncbi:hypothetical protein [Breznakiella homolactica]|uniref:Uncharacterized protein n=1 Tax=Breznakiella homolactica TaxID=2798577 RepID=A0A7T7XRN6_9SPIR|nr:hypothetical protein [Breznakiella homolactica]QQO11184.1 hypothetical protein JFL75_09810 [Breznakiella homolactica]
MMLRWIVKNIGAVSGLFLLTLTSVYAQESMPDKPALDTQDQILVLDISAGIVEQNQEVVWNSDISKTTTPGRPVSIQVVGQNIVVVAQFTPYLGHGNSTLMVAQGQVWIELPNEGGVRYNTNIQTIPLDFGEKIYFFPLGPEKDKNNAQIVIQLELNPYSQSSARPSAGLSGNPPKDNSSQTQTLTKE